MAFATLAAEVEILPKDVARIARGVGKLEDPAAGVDFLQKYLEARGVLSAPLSLSPKVEGLHALSGDSDILRTYIQLLSNDDRVDDALTILDQCLKTNSLASHAG